MSSNLIKLEVGQIIRNHRELCDLFDLKYAKGSKNRKYHIKEVERYCKFHKQGNKYIVDEVFKEIKHKIDNRKNNGGHIANTKYELLMDKIIINMLHEFAISKTIDISFSELFNYSVPMFSDGYNRIFELGYEEFARQHNMSKGLVLLYSQKVKKIVEKSLETSLDRLQRQDVINWNKNTMTVNSALTEIIADEKLSNQIKEIEAEVYDEMKIKPYNRVNSSTNRRFKKNVCKQLDDIIRYYKVYTIELLDHNIEEESDLDELITRFINSIHESVFKYGMKDDTGKTFYPYASEKNRKDTEKLDRLIWELPENYISLEDGQFEELFGDHSTDTKINKFTDLINNMGEKNIPF